MHHAAVLHPSLRRVVRRQLRARQQRRPRHAHVYPPPQSQRALLPGDGAKGSERARVRIRALHAYANHVDGVEYRAAHRSGRRSGGYAAGYRVGVPEGAGVDDGVPDGRIETDAEAGVGKRAIHRRLQTGKPKASRDALLRDRRARQRHARRGRGTAAGRRRGHRNLLPNLENLERVEDGVRDGAPAARGEPLALPRATERVDTRGRRGRRGGGGRRRHRAPQSMAHLIHYHALFGSSGEARHFFVVAATMLVLNAAFTKVLP